MAWIEQRQRVDGGLSARVLWRIGGGRGAPRQEETFSAGSDAQNQARAEGFKKMVEAAGNHWPDGWVKGEGFVRARADGRYSPPPSFAAVGEEYVRQIVDLSPGQRKRYLSQIRVLAGIEVRGTRIFGRAVDTIAERDIKAWLIDWDRSLKTKANYHGLLFGVFTYAAEQGHLTVNPCARTAPKRSRVRQSQAELRFLTEKELLTAARLAGAYGDIVTFAAGTGMRLVRSRPCGAATLTSYAGLCGSTRRGSATEKTARQTPQAGSRSSSVLSTPCANTIWATPRPRDPAARSASLQPS